MTPGAAREVERLIKMNLSFHNLNKLVESELGLSLVQYHCLAQVRSRPGISSLSLADAIGLHASSLTQTIKRLSKREYVFVGEHPTDSRRKMLSLTARGKLALDHFESQIERFIPSNRET